MVYFISLETHSLMNIMSPVFHLIYVVLLHASSLLLSFFLLFSCSLLLLVLLLCSSFFFFLLLISFACCASCCSTSLSRLESQRRCYSYRIFSLCWLFYDEDVDGDDYYYFYSFFIRFITNGFYSLPLSCLHLIFIKCFMWNVCLFHCVQSYVCECEHVCTLYNVKECNTSRIHIIVLNGDTTRNKMWNQSKSKSALNLWVYRKQCIIIRSFAN